MPAFFIGPSSRAALLGVAVLAAGCATPLDARKDVALHSQASIVDRPSNRPTRSLSSFSPSLQCMDRLLRDAELPTTLITSKQIPDASGRVPVAAKDMIITALSQMSRVSNAFRYVDYEVDIARQDTVQNLTTILLNNNQLQLQRPALYFSGAIAFVDQNVINNRFDAGTSATRLETGISQGRAASIVAMELHLGDFRTRTFIPGLDSANEVVLANGGQGLDLAGRIGSYGVQFNVGRDYTQGSGAAVRTLVELGTIELIGKWARVPYWQCLTLPQAHPSFQRQLRDWFDEGASAVHRQLVQRALAGYGYLAAGSEGSDDMLLRRALGRYQADRGLVVSGTIDFPTYERILADFTDIDAAGQITRVGWSSSSGRAVAVAASLPPPSQPTQGSATDASVTATASPPAFGDPAPPRTLGLQIENILLGRTAFETGEQVFLSLELSRAGHVACYIEDGRGTVSRVLPNGVNTQTLVSANQALRIPDWMSPNPGFVLDAGVPGREGLACIVTDEDVRSTLPLTLQGNAFMPIEGAASLFDVASAYQRAAGRGEVGMVQRYWNVVARPAGAAGAAASVPPAPPAVKR